MAKLCDLPSCFMQGFLKANPNSLVDSNGYLRSEYEAELARRNESVAPSSSVPDPRTFRPQFECTGETEPAFELPDEQLGIVRPEVMAHAEASMAQNAELLALLTSPAPEPEEPGDPISLDTIKLLADTAPRTIDWNKASKLIEQKTGYDIQEPIVVPVAPLTQEQVEAVLTAPLVVTTTPAPPIAEGAQRLRIVDDPADNE